MWKRPAYGAPVRPDSPRVQTLSIPLITSITAITALLLVWLLWAQPAWNLDIGAAGDARFVENFFAPDATGDTTFRWSSPGSRLMLHGASGAPNILSMRMHSRIEGGAGGDDGDEQGGPRPLRLERQGDTLATIDVSDSGWRVYRVLLPERALTADVGGDTVPLDLTGPARFHETRLLGMAIDRVQLVPLPAREGWDDGLNGWLIIAAQRAALLAWVLAGVAGAVLALDRSIWPRSRGIAGGVRVGVVTLAAACGVLWLVWQHPHVLWAMLPAPLWLVIIGGVGVFAPRWLRWLADDGAGEQAGTRAGLGRGRGRVRGQGDTVQVRRHIYVGLFLIALATLMYENLLTRIFSVTMWYHFAFIAISVAMFGMTVGAIVVYLFPRFFTVERAARHMALSSLLFAVGIVFSFLTHLTIPFITDREVMETLVGVYAIALTYAVIAVPFVFSGICVTLALTKFPEHVSTLYAADLAGAALGCLLIIATLNITDGPTAVIVVSLLASIGAGFFAFKNDTPRLLTTAAGVSLVLAAFAVYNTQAAASSSAPSDSTSGQTSQSAPLRLVWVKGEIQPDYLYEKWNSFSRIAITGDMDTPIKPLGWGMSNTFPDDETYRQLWLTIDASAGTALTAYHGDTDDIAFLRYDVTNVAHYLLDDADVLVVGIGGGRDLLSALAFDQRSATGVEINDNIIEAVNNEFGNFTGYLNEDPRITFVNDEARSFIARQQKQYDMVQVSLIDTWAATTSGAFVLTENSLYTVEAWELFLNRLSPDGVLSFSRWYFRGEPGEMYRVTALATAALRRTGVTNTRDHIVIVRSMKDKKGEPDGIGTILVSREPFSPETLNTLEDVCARLQFDVVLSPRTALDPTFATIASGEDFESFTANFPINIAPPTDDSPFFFHMLRFRDMFNPNVQEQEHGAMAFNMQAVRMLGILLLVVLVLTVLCIIVPLAATTEKASLRGSFPLLLFFACIGLGFMLVEISQLQRLIVFLGHPTYSLSVVLFTVLLASGLGSSLTERVNPERLARAGVLRLAALLCVLAVFGLLTPTVIERFQASTTLVRVLVAVATLFPLGLFMGMAFPLGMKVAADHAEHLTPWLWGINGATSVCASVLAVAIALTSSISTSFWSGVACYVGAWLAFAWASTRRGEQDEQHTPAWRQDRRDFRSARR